MDEKTHQDGSQPNARISEQMKQAPKTSDNRETKIKQQRQMRIAERRSQIPRKHRALYDRAVSGKSLRAAINAQCLECVGWVSREVTLRTDLACPLYAVRPYQLPQNADEGHSARQGSKNSGQKVSGQGGAERD